MRGEAHDPPRDEAVRILVVGPDWPAKLRLLATVAGRPPVLLPAGEQIAYAELHLNAGLRLLLVAAPDAPASESWPGLLREAHGVVILADPVAALATRRLYDRVDAHVLAVPYLIAVDRDHSCSAVADRSFYGLAPEQDIALVGDGGPYTARKLMMAVLRLASQKTGAAAEVAR